VHNPNFAAQMNIAVNIRFLSHKSFDGYSNFVRELVGNWLQNYPQHYFILITDNDNHGLQPTANSIVVKAGFPARTSLLWHFWYNFTIPKILRKYKAAVFVSPDGFCSLRTTVPQIMVIHDLSYIQYPNMFPKLHLRYFKKYMQKMAEKATAIATVSAYSKTDIEKFLGIPAKKIQIIYSGVKPKYQPLEYSQIENTRTGFADGWPYFLHIGTITPRKNIIALLKAFTIFKRRQQSNIKLILVGRVPNSFKDFKNTLNNYKHKADVVLLENITDEQLANIIGSAYALVYPSLYEGFGVPPLEAMQAGIPVIASGVSSIPEICGDAAHFVNPNDVNDIYEGLKTIYINDSYKDNLIAKGLEQCKQYTWERTMKLLWQNVEAVI
jgi:glycosyltransferase involved in cell wall biosynthesis